MNTKTANYVRHWANQKCTRVVAFDTETDPIRAGNVCPDLMCVSTAERDENGVLAPQMRANGDPDLEDFLRELICDDTILLVGHNTAFDLAVIGRRFPELMPAIWLALENSRVTDTGIREKLLRISDQGHTDFETMPDGTTVKLQYGLDDLGRKYLHKNRTADKKDADSWRTHFNMLDGRRSSEYPHEAIAYVMEDSIDTLMVWECQNATIMNSESAGPLSCRTEDYQTLVAFALFLTTCSGLHVDHVQRLRVIKMLENELSDDKMRLLLSSGVMRPAEKPRPHKRQSGGQPIKFTKAKPSSINKAVLFQVVAKACKDQGVTLKKTKGSERSPEGNVSTEAAFLEDLRAGCPIIDQYLHRAEQQKVVQGLAMIGDANIVYPRFNVLVNSGRTSSSGNTKGKPALYPSINGQNQDPRVRGVFVAPPGEVLVSSDYSSLELIANAQTLRNIFGEASTLERQLLSGIDPHAKLGSRIALNLDTGFRDACEIGGYSGDPLKVYQYFLSFKKGSDAQRATYSQWRTLAKPVGLGFPGGLGPKTICVVAKKQYNLTITEELAGVLRDLWREEYPEMPEYFRWMKNHCRDPRNEDCYSYVSPLGMYRAGCSYTSCANGMALQTPGAEGAKLGHTNVVRAMFDSSWKSCLYGCRPVNFVHDETIARMPHDEYLTERAFTMSGIMVNSLAMVMPDLEGAIKAQPAAMLRWDKQAETVLDSAGRLQVWQPKQK